LICEKAEIEELVRLSYQAFSRGLEELSRQIIQERNWGERVAALNQEQSRIYPQYSDHFPDEWRPRRPGNSRYPDSELEDEYAHTKWGQKDRLGASTSKPEFRNRPPPRAFKAGNLDAGPNRTESSQEGKSGAASEVRFTLPRLTPTRPVASPPPPPLLPSPKPAPSTAKKELQEANKKLERLKKRKEEAERINDFPTAADLAYYAIPDMQSRVETLERALLEKGDNKPASTTDQRQRRVPLPSAEVETDTESSEDDEIPKSTAAQANSDSDGDSAGMDLYE
jgi:hypothetical protein